MNAIDTNVLAYAWDDRERAKQARARELFERLLRLPEPTLLPWQVICEFLSVLRKWEIAGRIATADVRAHFQDMLAMFPTSFATVRSLDVAFEQHERFSLSHWDGLLLGACKEAGVTTLFSEDLDHGTDYGGLVVVNPLA